MSTTWKGLPARQRRLIQETAAAMLLLDGFASPATDAERRRERPVTFQDLSAWVRSSDSALPVRLQLALAADPRLRHDLDRLLARSATWHGPRASAASSGRLDSRDADGFRIRLKPSRAAADQVYVLITLTGERSQDPTTLAMRSADGEYVKWSLPRPQSGVIQILTDEAADGLRLLRDPKSELYLW